MLTAGTPPPILCRQVPCFQGPADRVALQNPLSNRLSCRILSAKELRTILPGFRGKEREKCFGRWRRTCPSGSRGCGPLWISVRREGVIIGKCTPVNQMHANKDSFAGDAECPWCPRVRFKGEHSPFWVPFSTEWAAVVRRWWWQRRCMLDGPSRMRLLRGQALARL